MTQFESDPSITDKKFVCKETFWWDGLLIIPPRPKLGLLSNFTNRVDEPSAEESSEECSEEETSSTTSSESEEGSAESNPALKMAVTETKFKKKNISRLWQNNLSARSNQDMQRAYEEKILKEMTSILNKTTNIDAVARSRVSTRNTTHLGGIWIRLEAEWKEGYLCHNNAQQKPKSVFTTTSKMNRFRGK